jgi:hypothetical protein
MILVRRCLFPTKKLFSASEMRQVLREKLGIEKELYLILGACSPTLAARTLEPEPGIGLLLPYNVVVRASDAGRGLAAALVLGAQGVNIDTRFLASLEAPFSASRKQAILAAESEDVVKVEGWNDIIPLPGGGRYGTVPRALRTHFIEEWQQRRNDAKREAFTERSDHSVAAREVS